jgi:MYXO-CTERM domain-containing protein
VRACRWAVRLGVAAALVNMAPLPALAQGIVFQSASSGADVEPMLAFDHTLTSATDPYLVVAVATRSSSTSVLSVTWGGAPLARLSSAGSSGYCRSELWGLAGPASGTRRVEVTLSGGGSVAAVAMGYAGVDQSNPLRVTAANFGNGGAASATLGDSAGLTVIDALCAHASSIPTATADSGQSPRYQQNSNDLLARGSDRPGAASVTMSWTITVETGGLGWAIAAVALAPAIPTGGEDAGPPPDSRPPDSAPPADAAPDGAPPDSDGVEPDAAAPRDQATGDAPGGAGDDAGYDAAADAAAPPDAGNAGPDAGNADVDAAADGGAGDAVVRARDIDLAIGCACRAAGRDPASGGPLALLAAAALAFSASSRRRRGPRAGAAPTRAGASPSSWPPPPRP